MRSKIKIKSLLNWLFLSLIVINSIYVLSGAVHYPVGHIDVCANWLHKAEDLYQDNYSLQFLQNWQGEFAHPQYPILLPMIFATTYQFWGGVNLLLPGLLSPVIYCLVLLLAYFFLKQLRISTTLALIITFIYSMMSPMLAQGGRHHAGMADIYLTLLYWLGIWVVWLARKKHQSAKLSWWLVPLVIVASLIKFEGIALMSLVLFLPISRVQKVVLAAVASLGFIGWQLAIKLLTIPSDYGLTSLSWSTFLSKPQLIVSESFQEIFLNYRNWYYFWWLFILLLLGQASHHSFVKQMVQPIFLLLLTFFLGMYLVSSVSAVGYVSSSLDRILLQTSPFWLIIFADRIHAQSKFWQKFSLLEL